MQSMRPLTFAMVFLCALLLSATMRGQCFDCAQAPAGTIFCDDFEDGLPLDQKYFEVNTNNGDCVVAPSVGRDGTRGLRIRWQKGEVGAGGLSKSFGRTPSAYIGRHAASPTSTFTEIYWRMDVRMQPGWTGAGPAKLSRALVLANDNWAEGMMAHLWSGGAGDRYLGMDPASGINPAGVLVSTKYNDFDNLRWLGWKPGRTDMFNDANAGRWYCVEGHVKLNTPSASDGVFEFWIDDTLQAGSYNLNWHGNWNADPANMAINAVFFENYWNAGSPVEQERYFDNLVISTARIGCACQTTSVGSVPETPRLRVFPNPAEGVVAVDIPSGSFSGELQVHDVLGRRVHSQRVEAGARIQVDLSNEHRGMYFFTVSRISGATHERVALILK
jgi:hypothetical protein